MLKSTARKADIYSAYQELNHTKDELETQQRILFIISGVLLILNLL